MTGASDGMNYAPRGKARPVVEPGAFTFAAAFLEHGHIHGQCNGLIEAGAELRWVYDPDPTKVEAFRKVHPGVRAARSFDEVLDDPAVRLVAAAAVPCERAAIGMQVMRAGKDYFTDKAPFTSLDQLAQVRRVVEETRRRYAVYFSERLHVECAIRAGELIEQGAIGRVIQIIGLGPHRLSAASRPDWFWSKAATGGILCDLASHQCEQFLHYAGAATGRVNFARVANVCHPEHPEFEDFGEASFTLDNGVSCYLRVDWFTPDGLRTWGDGRTIILGTEGYIELRKYVDVTTDAGPDQLILVDSRGEHRQSLRGQGRLPVLQSIDPRLSPWHGPGDAAGARLCRRGTVSARAAVCRHQPRCAARQGARVLQNLMILSMLAGLTGAALAQSGMGASTAAGQLPAQATTIEQLIRRPVATVPMGSIRVVSNNVDRGSVALWAHLQDMVVAMGDERSVGWAAAPNARVALHYDEHALHIRFEVIMPEGAEPKVTSRNERDTSQNDDAVEVFLSPTGHNVDMVQFGGNAGGTFWDRPVGQGNFDWGWNPAGVTYEAGPLKTEYGWWGQFTIPFEALGRTTPTEGETWRANFLVNRRTPETRLDGWAFWDKWKAYDGNGYLVFRGPSQPYLTVFGTWQTMFDTQTPRAGMRPGVMVHPGDDPAASQRRIEADVRLYRRDPELSNENFHRALQDRRNQATGEAATFASYEKDLADTMAGYEFVKRMPDTFVKTLPDPTWTGPWPGWYTVDQAGDYLIAYRYADVTDPSKPFLIGGGAVPFQVRSGVQIELEPYLLSHNMVAVTADYRAMRGEATPAVLRVQLRDGDGTALVTQQADYNGAKSQAIELPLHDVPVDRQNVIVAEVLDASGQVISSVDQAFDRPADPWWWTEYEQYASQPAVPQPWSPVVWRDGVAEVWGRRIELGEHLFPRQIVNQGQPMLAAPMELELTVAGKRTPWQRTTSKVVEERPDQVILETTQEAAGLRVRGTHRLEFDGFSLIDMAIEPTDGPVSVDRLELVLPIRAEWADYLTNYQIAPGPGQPPAGKRYVGRLPDAYTSPPMITTWIGDAVRGGLEVSMEWSRGWALDDPNTAIEVCRTEQGAVARFQFIDHRFTIDQPRHIQLGLIATPTKPVPERTMRLRVGNMDEWPPVDNSIYENLPPYEERLANWKQWHGQGAPGQLDVTVRLLRGDWSGYMVWHPYVTDPKRRDWLQRVNANAAEHGVTILWNGGWALASYAPEWDPWGKEMRAEPSPPTYAGQFVHTYASPFVEFFVSSWARNARELGIAGVRFDTIVPWHVSSNPYFDEAWQGIDGKTYGRTAIFRIREMMKGLYRAFEQAHGKPGIIYLPTAGPPILAVHSFAMFNELGEGVFMHGDTLAEAYDQLEHLPWFTGQAYGLRSFNNIKGATIGHMPRIGALLAMGAEPRLFGRPSVRTSSYVTRSAADMATWQIWGAWSWIDRATAQWHPHWANGDMVSSSAGGAEHYVSFHLQPGRRVLLVATNYSTRPATIDVKLNLEALGFNADAPLRALDIVTGKEVPIDAGRLSLDAGPELFRYLMIGTLEEINGPYLDPTHPRSEGWLMLPEPSSNTILRENES